MPYEAIVTLLTDVRPHPNADRLKLATVAGGHQVVVSSDAHDGMIGVYFDTDGQLSHEMCLANDLYNESSLRELQAEGLVRHDHTAARYGFFTTKRRVRAQRFRGEKSNGFWVELETLAFTDYDLNLLSPGDMFCELQGVPVCNKYYNPATLRAMASGQLKKQPDAVFPKHKDTDQFRYAVQHIKTPSLVYISEKLHGTSGRFGNVLMQQEPKGLARYLQRAWCWLRGVKPPTIWDWTPLNGSRNVILEKQTTAGFYGTNEFRYALTNGLKLHKGEVIYFEIVGYTENETPIMQPQPIQDKELIAEFGPAMAYTYGCAPGQAKMFVYRIARLNEDGIETELSWLQVEARCKELGLDTVPLVADPGLVDDNRLTIDELIDCVIEETEGLSVLDERHIREGVVVRVEGPTGTFWMKNKSWHFGVLEGYIKDDSTYVDTEEVA